MPDPKPTVRPVWVTLVLAAELAFVIYFFSFELPNSGPPDSRVSRVAVWQFALGWSGIAPGVEALRAVVLAQWVPDRLRIVGYASLILAGALAIGHLLLSLAGLGRFHSSSLEPPSGESASDQSITTLERLVFAYGLGFSAISLATLALGLAGLLNRVGIISGLVAVITASIVQRFRHTQQAHQNIRNQRTASEHSKLESASPFHGLSRFDQVIGIAAAGLFVTIMLLGALLPATDFDVREYHLQVPKEFYQSGRVTFMPHNVYGNMPFATEMIHLLGMVVAGDWWWGALVGQVLLASFAPMTAIGIWSLGRRVFGAEAGWLAALIYVTTPWVYRISIIPYTEGALCYFLLTTALAVACAIGQMHPRRRTWLWWLAGTMAGSAAACKYPALISTVLPVTICAAYGGFGSRRAIDSRASSLGRAIQPLLAVAIGVVLTFGPWLAKNWLLTGNPVYPLLFRVFDGRNWSAEKNAKWEWGHRVSLLVAVGLQRPPQGQSVHPADPQTSLSARRLKENLVDVIAQADWQSPLVFGLAPLALLCRAGRRTVLVMWAVVIYLFLQWWLLTHRLDRFWVPLLPIASVLAGAGAAWSDSALWRRSMRALIILCVFYNFSFCATPLCGDNRYAAPLEWRRDPIDAAADWLNDNLPGQSRVLAVGSADLFHLDREYIYNTVFDDCIFEQLVRDREQAAAQLRGRGITHIYVNWAEIERYRQPGSYGFSEFVRPERFRELVEQGVLVPVRSFGAVSDRGWGIPIPASQLFAVGAANS